MELVLQGRFHATVHRPVWRSAHDYDPVRRSPIYKSVYYAVRRILFWRDNRMIARLRGGKVIGG